MEGFLADDGFSSGAAIAFYLTIGLPPLLVLVFFLGDAWQVPRSLLESVVREQLGLPALASLQGGLAGMAENAQLHSSVGEFGLASRILGLLMILSSATGAFVQLQGALNLAWDVQPDPERSTWRDFLMKRVLSLAMIAAFGLVLLASLVVTTLLNDILAWTLGQEPGLLGTLVSRLLDLLVSLAVATVMFAFTFKILPDVVLKWRHVWIGAALTAALFTAGKSLMGWLLPEQGNGGPWGAAASSMAAMLIWVYYNALIVIYGAEVTRAWANQQGARVEAVPGARVEERT